MNMSKSLGLRPTLLYKNEDDILSFTNVVVPSSMRSPLWKHFGFPADENREILTRSKIVCCICYQSIAYNKNTTNLSTHLTNKHPEVITKMKKVPRKATEQIDGSVSPKRKMKAETTVNWYSNDDDDSMQQHSIDPNKMQQRQQHPTGITQKTFARSKKSIYKPKFQITEEILHDFNGVDEDDDDESGVKSSFDDITEHEHDDQFQIEAIDYAPIDMHEDGNEIIDEANSNRSKDDFLSTQYITITDNNELVYENSPKKMALSSLSPQKAAGSNTNENNPIKPYDSADIMEQMKKFFVKDLITPTIANGSGFKEMITFFSHSVNIPNSVQVNILSILNLILN